MSPWACMCHSFETNVTQFLSTCHSFWVHEVEVSAEGSPSRLDPWVHFWCQNWTVGSNSDTYKQNRHQCPVCKESHCNVRSGYADDICCCPFATWFHLATISFRVVDTCTTLTLLGYRPMYKDVCLVWVLTSMKIQTRLNGPMYENEPMNKKPVSILLRCRMPILLWCRMLILHKDLGHMYSEG